MTRVITRCVAAAGFLCALFAGSGMALAQSSATRTASFAYDASSGLLTQEVVEPGTPSLRLQTDYTYDASGNKLSTTLSGVDIVTRSSSSTYDAEGQFVRSNSNALGQSESFQYDARFGQPTSQTGPNGLTTSWSYDSFGRKIQEIRPDGTETKWTYQFCSGVNNGTANCVSGASYLIEAIPYAANGATINGPTTTVYFDSLNRDIATDTQGFDGSTIRQTKTYDALGRVSQTSRPYFVNGGTPQLTTYIYDALGRVLTRTRPDGSVSQVAYDGLTVVTTNALNQTRSVTRDSQGNVVSVTDALGQTMSYAYDAFGNLIQTTDPVGNVVTASYDVRGDKIASSDPDLGSWSYTYNTLGLLVTQTNGNNQTTTLTYDKLDRLVQQVEPDMTSQWVYDTAAHGIGKLASTGITAGPGSGYARSTSYDALGRTVQVATTIDGATYAMAASYDANGHLARVSYPSGFTARYAYTGLGDPSQLLDDATGQAYWTANALDAELRLTQQTAGNGLVTTDSFDAATGHLTGIATGTGSAVQNLSFTYDRGGNPLSRSDANSNLSETFTYDALKRLTSSTVHLSPTPLSKTFSYDPIGNLLSKSDLGNYSYPAPGAAQPHAVMSISGGSISATFTYDPSGNQTSGLGRSIVFTSYNKPASITQGTRTISFLDDTDHQRFKQMTPEGSTLYISAFGVLTELASPGATGQKWTDYLSVGNSVVGMRVLQTASSTLSTRYFHTDPLGSISAITDENGNVVERLSYDAWGKRRFPNGTDDPTGSITSQSTRGFTGEEELSVSGLVHLNGRVYDPRLARMTSADPTVPHPWSTQGWNRYSYVNNRPVKKVDPTGYYDDGSDGTSTLLPPISVTATPPIQYSNFLPCGTLGCGGSGFLPCAQPGCGGSGAGYIGGPFSSPSSGLPGLSCCAPTPALAPWLTSNSYLQPNLPPLPTPISNSPVYPSPPISLPSASPVPPPPSPVAPPPVPQSAATANSGTASSYMGNAIANAGNAILGALHPNSGMFGFGEGGGLGWVPGAPEVAAVESGILLGASALGRLGLRGAEGVDGLAGENAARGLTAGNRVNMPAWKRITVDMDEVASGHMAGGSRLNPGNTKDLFPEGMSPSSVERAIRDAYRNGKVLQTQTDAQGVVRTFVRGPFENGSIEMWVNKSTKTIESAWPKF